MVSKSSIITSSLLLGGLLLGAAPASAQLLYCCTGNKNVRHCGDSLPQQCIGRAYTVRGQGGRTVREVAAPLTPEQLKAKQLLEEKEREEEARRKEQALQDKALLATYSSVEQIDRARDRAEAEMDASIAQTQGKLDAANKKLNALTDPNVIKERMSPEEMKHRTGELEREVGSLKEILDRKLGEKAGMHAKYAEDKRRYVEIKTRGARR